jgi:tetratricopeptide (TPR) repeat protein
MPGAESTSNDVFISYRREVGGILALALLQQLEAKGINVFYDLDSIRAGQFDTLILRQIAARPYFLLVLTPGTLERCVEADDWLRREIEQAVATSRVIIPAHTPGFDFGDFDRFLPGELGQTVRRFNGQELPQRWFNYAVQQLVEEYLLLIDIDTKEVSAEDEVAVDRLRREVQAAPPVSQVALTAQEFFERAFARSAGDLDATIADYTEAIRLNPQYTEAFTNRGFARAAKGDRDGAIADYNEAIRLNPQMAIAFYNRGIVRKDKGDHDGAIADYNEAIRVNPQYTDAFINRGSVRKDKGDHDGAIADYSEAIRLNPQMAIAFFNRGVVRAARDQRDGAIADYSEAIRLNPQMAIAFNNRGIVRRDKGDHDGAIADYSEAIRLNPQYAKAFYNRALSRKAHGDFDGAIADLEQGSRYAPDDKDFRTRLAAYQKEKKRKTRRWG